MLSFTVTYGEMPVGEVTLERVGLYCRIRCLCKSREGALRLVDRRDTGDLAIGICCPMPGGYGLDKKIPVKYMDNATHCFLLVDIHEREGLFYPLSQPMPCSVLRQPEKCRYAVRDGVSGIVIENC